MSGRVPAEWFHLRAPSPRPRQAPLAGGYTLEGVLREIHEHHAPRQDHEPPSPREGSELAADDTAVLPYLVSGAIQGSIAQALDHLEAMRALVQDVHVVHPWAQYTLLRAALESGATAVWLIQPDEPTERRFRLLRWMGRDLLEAEKAHQFHGVDNASGRTFTERRAQLLSLAPGDRREKVLSTLSYRSIVRDVAESICLDADTLELTWRTLSGLAHGAQWATLGMLEHSETDTAREGVVNVRFTGSTETLMLMAVTVLRLVDVAEMYWRQRA